MIRHSLLSRENWDCTAVIDDEKHYTYHELNQKAITISHLLPRKGHGTIALYLPNSTDYIAALYGTLMAGMTVFPLNTQLTVHEAVPLLAQASVMAVITSKEHRSIFDGITSVQALYMEDLPESMHELNAPHVTIGEDEPMILLATSGTTGKAKIAQLSEKNVASSTLAYIDKMDFEKFSDKRLTLGTPFSSAYGLMVLTACVIKSIPIVVIKETLTLDTLFRAAEKYRITHFEGGVAIGLLMARMAGRQSAHDISSFRYFGLAGSNISADVLKRLVQAYPGVEFWPGYGMTEAGPLIAKPDKRVNMDKLDSVGTKIDCVTIMIDVNGKLTDAPGEKGEIAVKGPNVMSGYYENEEETRKVLKGGYLYTGDIGYLDEDGYLYICGRKKNIIIVRGYNVHAEEVEACIMNSGLVKDCVVYGQTDSAGMEIVCADILPADPLIHEERLRFYCKEHLAGYKLPKIIRFVDKIKKTATGKAERT